jgi:type I restriction enzyme M protein
MECERAWRVPVDQIAASGYNLDIKNPNATTDLEHLPPEQLVASIIEKERRILELMDEVRVLVDRGPA